MTDVDERRRFNGGERAELLVRSGGQCAECGVALTAGWHADHRDPWAAGGRTTLRNGQSLCPTCNMRKGSTGATALVRRTGALPAWSAPLRAWQTEAFALSKRTADDFLAVVTPGGGKTRFALRIAHDGLLSGAIERVVVVVPTDNLRSHWRDDAYAYGISLHSSWVAEQGWEPADDHGIVITYAALRYSSRVLNMQCGQKRTLVIFDEVHHAGDVASWGLDLRDAFRSATRRLLLSGTPRRTDETRIPFVQYHDDGRYRADFTYGYGQALVAVPPVCRSVVFMRYDGVMDWWSHGKPRRHSFGDEIPESENAHLMTTALKVDGEFLPRMLESAHATLLRKRANGQPQAGGLVIAYSIIHARLIAAKLLEITGSEPAIATSAESGASDTIDQFRDSSDPWIVTVRMISEGVDIPRLAVGVYASTIVTSIFFRQFVGRFVRWESDLGDEQSAAVYLPDYGPLVQYAELIKQEEDDAVRAIQEEVARDRRDQNDADTHTGETSPSDFKPGQSELTTLSGVTFAAPIGDGSYTADEWQEAEHQAERFGITADLTVVRIADMIRDVLTKNGLGPAQRERPPGLPPERNRALLSGYCSDSVNSLARLMSDFHPYDELHPMINGRLKKLWGQERRSLAQDALSEQLTLLDAWVAGLAYANRSGLGGEWFGEWKRGQHDAVPGH